MVPLKDNVPTPGVPALTLLVILASVVLYVLGWDPDLTDVAWPWAALGSLLMSTSLLALAINMLFLWLFAESLEGAVGPAWLAALLVAAGLAAAGAEELARPSTTVPTVGIAGSIAGLIGAYAVCLPRARILCWVLIPFFVTFVEVPALILAALWLALQAIPDVGQPPALGLVVGLAVGLLGGWLFARARPGALPETSGAAP